MCKHFSVKVPATYNEEEGRVTFPFGECAMMADDDSLTIVIDVKDEESAAKAEGVIVSHLVKFAWREELTIQWNRTSDTIL